MTGFDSASAFELQDKQFDELRELVFEHTGIRLSEVKKQLVSRRFTPRLKALGISDFREYCEIIRSGDKDELVEFSNVITTNLTSFFRENHHFEYLKNELIPKLKKQNSSTKKIRIWSAGCSTGQEPYSIAMVIRECFSDIKSWDIKILATDLDTTCLDKCKLGEYEERLIEGISNSRLTKWFDKSENGGVETLTAKPELKSLIHFKHLNLMKPFPFKGDFDAIFCRNVLIYFDKPTQKMLIEKYARHQLKGAPLIIGHSENLTTVTDTYKLVSQTVYLRD